MKKYLKLLFSTRAGGIYTLLFAIVIAVATFIENDYGTDSAQKLIFQSRWFEFLLLLFAGSILYNIFKYKLLKQKKWATFLFHVSIIVILLGSLVTRYFGYEGMMHIREGKSSNEFVSSEAYLQFEVNNQGQTYAFEEEVLFLSTSKNKFKKSYQLGDKVLEAELLDFYPNPETAVVEDSENGTPIIKLVYSGMQGREDHVLEYNKILDLGIVKIGFGNSLPHSTINIKYEDGKLLFNADFTLVQMLMSTQQKDTLESGLFHPLLSRALYSNNNLSFVLEKFIPKGKTVMKSSSAKLKRGGITALKLKLTADGNSEEVVMYGAKGNTGRKGNIKIGDMDVAISYGSRVIKLPFRIKLNKFILENYPGTKNASSYASEVTLIDPANNIHRDERIYMNHILNYKGYRFFQSSFDRDELGTYLSVNHDGWGTWVTYIGYFLLTLGMLLSLLDKKSRFRIVGEKLRKMGNASVGAKALIITAFLTATSFSLTGQSADLVRDIIIPAEHAEKFGHIIVQDHKGRFKPVNTLSSEVLRKISRKERFDGLNADQVFIGMTFFPKDWQRVPMIKMGRNKAVRALLNADKKYLAFNDFFDDQGKYILQNYVREAQGVKSVDRGTFEKELIKLDEKVNICYMVFSGRFLKWYPLIADPDNRWVSPMEIKNVQNYSAEQDFIRKFYPAYENVIHNAVHEQKWDLVDQLADELTAYQYEHSGDIIPSRSKIKLELLLNKFNVFKTLEMIYGLLGLLILLAFFISVFNEKINRIWIQRIAIYAMMLAFLFHTMGLGIRWYIGGHAPWSNGYESLVYIAWTSVLAGLFLSRKSLGGLAATAVLAATILMVAGLSWMDPEITPLVPVLKSYWLTIHVSLEAGSYGFLMLGAIIGVLNLILMVFKTQDNQKRFNLKIKELSYISELTLTVGLIMVSVGTYLGGIWANESWGRYWGWDAKETWALVTILVYAFILHMRLIPGMKSLYAFNVASLFGFATVIMTYFGVNYYLSGLHSYATGDPVPIPDFVYYTVVVLLILSIAAYLKNRYLAKLNKG